MKFNCKCLSHVHLDPVYSLLTAREVAIVWEFFKMLDIRSEMALDGTIYRENGRINPEIVGVYIQELKITSLYVFM